MSDVREDLRRVRWEVRPPEDAFDRFVRRRERKHRNRRTASAVVALVVAAAGIGGAVWAFRGSARSGPGDAGRAAAGPTVDLTLGPGQYSYREVETYRLAGEGYDCSGCELKFPYVTKSQLRVWWAADDSGRVVGYENGIEFFSADERRLYEDANGPALLGTPVDTTYRAGKFANDSGDLSYLSTDPGVLLQQMIDRMQPTGRSPEPYEDFTPGPGQDGHITAGLVRSIGELLQDPNGTPALKSALFRVAEGLQGMAVTRGATDPAGRPAVQLRIQTENQLHRWWFDPDSQQLMAMEESSVDGKTVWSITIVRQAGIRSSTADDSEWVQRFAPDASDSPAPTIPDPRS
jgi:hypothetical protein